MAYRFKARSATPGDYNFVAGSLGFAPDPGDVLTTTHIGDGTPGTLVPGGGVDIEEETTNILMGTLPVAVTKITLTTV